ncbi:heat- and acid-stable phosphoprotein [Mortierella sp. NVP85]|nr:heat- and acid-stable phosphoprotein [Mortierella sp. NVP85]
MAGGKFRKPQRGGGRTHTRAVHTTQSNVEPHEAGLNNVQVQARLVLGFRADSKPEIKAVPVKTNQKAEVPVSKTNNLSLDAGLSNVHTRPRSEPKPKSNPDSKPETNAVPVKTNKKAKVPVSKTNNPSLEAGLSNDHTRSRSESKPDSKPETKAVPVKTNQKATVPGFKVNNPNRLAPINMGDKNMMQELQDMMNMPTKMSREERKRTAKLRYLKMHRAGMTDEAKSDLERLAVIRKQREDAAALRQVQSNAKEGAIAIKMGFLSLSA